MVALFSVLPRTYTILSEDFNHFNPLLSTVVYEILSCLQLSEYVGTFVDVGLSLFYMFMVVVFGCWTFKMNNF